MYYILNETDQIIAADDDLLTLCAVTDMNGLSSKIAAGDTTFSSQNEENVKISMNASEQTYSVSKTPLSSTLGHLTLVEIGEAQENEMTINEELLLDTDELFELNDTVEENASPETMDTQEEKVPLNTDDGMVSFDIPTDENDDELIAINETIEEVDIPETADTIEEEEELFDLLSDPSESIDEPANKEEDDGEIIVDVATTSQIMGISDEDYTSFLNEYIDTALALEEDLQSDNLDTRHDAIMTLTDLSEIMHLPEISRIIQNIHASTPAQQKGYIGSLYTTLSRLTTKSSDIQADQVELFDSIEAEVSTPEEPIVEKEINPNGFGTIDLSDVKPKHFDFQLEEAANDLSLPVELIEEFVHDFIEQAHIETKNMLKAYEEGDLAKVQAIGHLLKGASSNLRIKDLSDTLYKIQFCENENGLDDLIKDYWAHFLSFEHQIDVISK